MDALIPAITELLTVIIYILITALTGALVMFIKEKFGVEKMLRIKNELENKESIAYRALQLIKEAINENGLVQENLDKATSWVSEQLTKKGIKVTQQEIEELIKSVYSQFKYEFMENWDDVTKEPEVVYNLTFNIEKKEDIEEVMRQIKK
jgi:hypothetical protein